ncbi:hypothetical protein [Mesorhizobium sp. CAU 1741]|uniref:hypothetical protein n=1 Tax=Mesorhizobium sp. CAU 1741 TaxID=3140366 RepID=UPI00325A9CF3
MNFPQREDVLDQAERMTDVLVRIHAELEEIARRIDHNQAMIAKSTWNVGAADEDYVKAMQDADLSAQRIAGVAGFLRALGDASKPDWRINTAGATSTLKLTELIRAIGTTDALIAAKPEDDAGNVDLF